MTECFSFIPPQQQYLHWVSFILLVILFYYLVRYSHVYARYYLRLLFLLKCYETAVKLFLMIINYERSKLISYIDFGERSFLPVNPLLFTFYFIFFYRY